MPVDDQVTGTSRWSVLREVKTPLTFFALAIIIVEGILFSVAQRADGLNLTLIISGTIALLFTLTGVVSYLTFKSAKDLTSGGALTVASEVTPVRHLTAYITPWIGSLNEAERRVQMIGVNFLGSLQRRVLVTLVVRHLVDADDDTMTMTVAFNAAVQLVTRSPSRGGHATARRRTSRCIPGHLIELLNRGGEIRYTTREGTLSNSSIVAVKFRFCF